MQPCSIVNHFVYVFSDTDDPSKNITFINNDQLNNTNSHSADKSDNLLLQKVRLCISTLATIQAILNSTIIVFQCLLPYLIVHVIGIENVAQNALSKDRTYDN